MTITETDVFLRLLVAIACGGAIGYERELREQPAGLRTHLLVALASATFTLVSLQVAFFQHYTHNGVISFDTGRIASNIVVGMGFLGGGAILRAGMTIKGLTTAATLWLTSSLGLAAGGGMFLLASEVTVISLVALIVLRFAVEEPRKRVVRMTVRLDFEGEFLSRAELIAFLNPVGADVTGADYRHDLSNNRSRMKIEVRLADIALEEPLMKRLEALPGVQRVKVRRPD